MNLQTRIGKLEAVISDTSAWNLSLLTDDELLALSLCYTFEGQPLPERVAPELAAALNRVKRRGCAKRRHLKMMW
jgi:hypothetical protein